MSEYIKNKQLDKKIIVAHPSAYTSALLPYLPGVKFWYVDIEDFATYVTWNTRWSSNRNISFSEIERRIVRSNLPKKQLLLLLTHPIPEYAISNYQLLHKLDKNVNGEEKFYLYRALSL